MTIRRLSAETVADWFDFFDHRAFSDHADWKGCYCTGPFLPRMSEYPQRSRRRRDYAEWLIKGERMKGYLAYEDGRVIGWCNVNLRKNLPLYATGSRSESAVLSIACFTVEKAYRRRGVATELLKRVIADAAGSGVRIIEAYPRRRAVTEFGRFLGPLEMYEKQGFKEEEVAGRSVMRRHLSA